MLVLLIMIIMPVFWITTRAGGTAITQPLPFSHAVHVEENDMECADCHVRVADHPRATIPELSVCQECHFDALTESELESELLAYTTQDRAIPWRRIYAVPDHVYFSHRRHITLGRLACETCHGQVGSFDTPPPAAVVPISMDGCMGCHREMQITNDCLACHR
ncbi:MAG: cytochrome c3 family protein [Candidatus Neomarinimicrobiota bacterium]